MAQGLKASAIKPHDLGLTHNSYELSSDPHTRGAMHPPPHKQT